MSEQCECGARPAYKCERNGGFKMCAKESGSPRIETSEQMRSEFEAWYESAYGISLEREFRSNHFIGYVNDKANHRWAAWQASRAALCVELPPEVAAGRWADDTGYFKDDVIEAIHAAGVKTR